MNWFVAFLLLKLRFFQIQVIAVLSIKKLRADNNLLATDAFNLFCAIRRDAFADVAVECREAPFLSDFVVQNVNCGLPVVVSPSCNEQD